MIVSNADIPPRPDIYNYHIQDFTYTEPCQHKVQEAIQNNYAAIAGTAVAVAVFQVHRQQNCACQQRLSG